MVRYRAVLYFQDALFSPQEIKDDPLAMMSMNEQELSEKFRRVVVPFVELGVGKVESMKLAQKLEGDGWAMVGFQMDGANFSVEPRVFIFDEERCSFDEVLFRSYDKERLER